MIRWIFDQVAIHKKQNVIHGAPNPDLITKFKIHGCSGIKPIGIGPGFKITPDPDRVSVAKSSINGDVECFIQCNFASASFCISSLIVCTPSVQRDRSEEHTSELQ